MTFKLIICCPLFCLKLLYFLSIQVKQKHTGLCMLEGENILLMPPPRSPPLKFPLFSEITTVYLFWIIYILFLCSYIHVYINIRFSLYK